MDEIMQIVYQAKEYLTLGIAAVILAAVIFIIIYYIIYRKIMKGTKKLSNSKILISAVFICYIMVVFGATLLGRRSSSWNNANINFQLFSSYRAAWNHASSIEWRNIILNILMFVPLGFLLPLWSKRFKVIWKTYLSGLLLTVLIEGIQLFAKSGIFEIDDIFNNTIGTVIGYGLVMLVLAIFKGKNNKHSIWKIISMQLPLIATVIGFASIFIVYQHQEYGNLSENYNYKVNMSKVEYSVNTVLSKQEKSGDIYNTKIGNFSETLEFANEFFAKLNTSVNESKNDIFEYAAIFHSMDGNYSLSVDYVGFKIGFTDFDEIQVNEKMECDFETVKKALSLYGISIPDKSEFSRKDDGPYTISVKMDLEGNTITDGVLRCIVNENGKIASIRNNIISYKRYKKCNVISEQEAYERIKEGKFLYYNSSGAIKQLAIQSVNLSYRMDSKGYFQPVYEFLTLVNGRETTIVIPCIK